MSLPAFVEYLVEAGEPGGRKLPNGQTDGQLLLEEGGADVFRLDVQNGHHDPAGLHFGVGDAQPAHERRAGRLVITDVIRMVADTHLIGMLIPHANIAIV